jgi:hypothetical protein
MKDKDRMMFLQEDGDGGGGGDMGMDEGPSQGAAVFDEPTAPSREAPRETQPSVPQAATVDARQLAHEFGSVIGQHFQQPVQQQRISPEEAKKLLNVWEPSDEWLQRYDNLETRTGALAELRDGLIRQADTIAQFRMREMMEGMERTYAPVVNYMQQQEARAGEWRFKQKFPDLAHDGLRPLLFSVSQNILAQGTPFRSEEELFAAIANGVEAVIKVSNPEFKLGNGSGSPMPAQRKQGRPVPGAIPVTSPGSSGGSGVRGGQGVTRPRGLAIFD